MNYLKNESVLFFILMALVALCCGYAVHSENYLIGIIPIVIIAAGRIVLRYTDLFYLFFVLIPFSIEYNFTPSLGTDLPTEPLMWLMFGVSILLFCQDWRKLKSQRYFNIITYLLLTHLVWIVITMLLSSNFSLSFKYFLAKLWYIVPFYFFAIHILKDSMQVERMIKSGVFTLSIAILIVLYRHSLEDFAFDRVNFVVTPIFRNHVNYACIIVIFLPYLWTLFIWEKGWLKFVYAFMMIIYAAGNYFSYTRAAIIAMVVAIGAYYVIRLKLVKPVLLATTIVGVLGISYLLYDNNYLRMNPEYESTVSHHSFDKLISATTKMEDISTMERVYRWVAGVEMIKEKPVFGFGPNTFYQNYSAYTVSYFSTYVSDNPEQSTVHNYFLLTFIEQGIIGFFIFILLCAIVLIYGENRYFQMQNKKDKAVIMAAMLSFIIILLLNLINDMIETDKVGPFFFLAMAIIGGYKNSGQKEKEQVQ